MNALSKQHNKMRVQSIMLWLVIDYHDQHAGLEGVKASLTPFMKGSDNTKKI
jgi:hypothetical protein